ncbi:MAG: AI-2E family transporter [Pseudomonadota bacterium]
MIEKLERRPIDLHIPAQTIVKVLLTSLVVWAGIRLWPEFVLLMVSIIMAVALHPLIGRLERRGLPRAIGVSLLAVALMGMAAVFVFFLLTSLADQLSRLAHDYPGVRDRVQQRIPAEHPALAKVVREIFALPTSPDVAAQLRRPLAWGTTAVSGVVATFFTLILSLYLILDGKRLYAWLIAYVPRKHRDKMATTVDEVSEVIYEYVRGQVITSVLFSVYVVIVLYSLGVPAAVPLALLAGLCDVLPVIGIVIATVPAVLLALAVSPAAAAAVLGLYVVYHMVESYVIVPRIYGQRLRLSTLAVLLALVAGNNLGGLIGAVLSLPLVAAYPIIERIWLAHYLNPEVIKDHKALAGSAAGTVSDDRAVETILQGQKHPWEGASGIIAASWRTDERGAPEARQAKEAK